MSQQNSENTDPRPVVSALQQRPTSTASPIPSRKPPIVVSGVLKSPCASHHTTRGTPTEPYKYRDPGED